MSSQQNNLVRNASIGNANYNSRLGIQRGFIPSRDDGCHWSLISAANEHLPHVTKRSKHTMVLYKNSLYVFGGDDGKRMLNDLIKYDIEADQWVSLSSRLLHGGNNPPPRYHHSAVVYKNSMFVFGGYAGLGSTNQPGYDMQQNSTNLHNKNDLHEYRFNDFAWIEWQFEGVTPTPRSAHCSFVYNKKLWIFGGYGSNRSQHDQRRLQILNDMWNVSLENTGCAVKKWVCVEQKGIIPPPCCNFSVTLVGNRLFLFSGVSGKEMTNHIFTFNLDTFQWTRISPEHILHGSAAPPQKRYGHTMVEYHHRLYVFGGSVSSATDSLATDLICFDLDHKSWEKVKPLPNSQCITGRLFHTAVVYNDRMYIFGGTVDTDRRSNELFAFKFPTFPKCTLTEDLLRLLTEERLLSLSDIFFTFPDGDRLPAHAVIVAARCAALKQPIIDARAEWASRPGVPEVFIPESNRNAFHLVLQYLYTDRIRPDFTSAASRHELLLQIVKVCKLAAVYSLVRLESLCLRFLEETICMDNILTVLSEAYSMNLSTLREYCIKKVVREDNFTALIQKEDFANLGSKIIVDLIRRHKQVQSVAPASPQSSCFSSEHPVHNSNQSSNAAPMPAENLEEGTLALDLFKLLEICFGISESESGADKTKSARLNSLEEFADVQLSFGYDLVIRAHRAVLAARSQYFLSLFDFTKGSRTQAGEEEEGETIMESTVTSQKPIRVHIDDIVPTKQALHSFLRYIYCGQTCMPPEDSLFLLRTPSYYGFTNDRLAHVCQQNLETNITVDTVIRVFITVDSVPQFSDFKERCLHFIVNHFPELGNSDDKHLLSKEQLCEIWSAYSTALSLSSASPSPASAGQHMYNM